MTKKRDVHRTGALGAILKGTGFNSASDFVTEKKPKPSSSILEQYSSLTEEPNEKPQLIEVSPSDCTPWKYANRTSEEFGDIKALASSLKNEGQQEPILIRPNNGKSATDTKYEIIFGRRRFEAAKLAGVLLLAVLKPLTDQEAAICQKAENENRESVSPYSEAQHYKKLLNDHCFSSDAELSKKLNIPKSTFSNLMAFTKIPSQIVDCLPNIHELSTRIAVEIVRLINLDSSNEEKILALAPKIGRSLNSAKQLTQLITETKQPAATPIKISSTNGTPLCQLTAINARGFKVTIEKLTQQAIPPEKLACAIKEALEKLL